MLKKITLRKKLKKIAGISAIALCSLTVTACAGGNKDEVSTASADSQVTDTVSSESMESVKGNPLQKYDVTEKMKAKGEKVDISDLAEKYRPMVKLAEYKGVAVSKGEAYEMTEEEIRDELDLLLENFRTYEDVTAGSTVQDKDSLNLSSSATVDGQAYDDFLFEDMYYEVGSQLITEDFDKKLVGKKAGEDFEIMVTFPGDYMSEEFLDEGEISLNGKDVLFKVNISKIERPSNETMDDDWVKKHQEDLFYYSYDGTNTLDELKKKIKTNSDENRAVSLLRDFGVEALEKVIKSSEFSSFPEDELTTLKDQTMSNIRQEFESNKDMTGVNTLEEYLETSYGITGETGLEDYATGQAQEYLKTKMAMILIADAAGIEIGEDDVKSIGDDMAAYYGMDSYDAMLQQYGESVRESAVFECIYDKAVLYLGSVADPSLEPEASDDMTMELPADGAASETSSAN